MTIERVYHPYWMWEETNSTMWRKPEDRHRMLRAAVAFTGADEAYGWAMMRVIKEWRFSCEHNLSNVTQNRRAWLGHAACALTMGFTEDVVREAWGHLSDEQRTLADQKAEIAIGEWERCQK